MLEHGMCHSGHNPPVPALLPPPGRWMMQAVAARAAASAAAAAALVASATAADRRASTSVRGEPALTCTAREGALLRRWTGQQTQGKAKIGKKEGRRRAPLCGLP